MEFRLTDEQRMIQEAVRDFARREIAPLAAELDETDRFPHELFRKMGEAGLLGIPYPEAYGGAGGDTVSLALAVEEIARVSGGVALAYEAHVTLGCGPIFHFGTEEQKRQFLPGALAGEYVIAMGWTEPGAGSDAAAIRTRAEIVGDRWRLTGRKQFCTSGSVARYAVISAVTDPGKGHRGISQFIVPTDTPGFQVEKDEEKMGMRGSATSALVLDGCEVPADHLLGPRGNGFYQFMKILDDGRIAIAALAVGLAQAAFEDALRYAKEREAFGHPIAHHQLIQAKLAEMATEIEAARLLVLKAAWLRDQGKPYTKAAAMAKMFATEMGERVCREAIQIHGGYGYIREYPVERYYRDVRLTTIGEGTSEIMRLVIARQLLRE